MSTGLPSWTTTLPWFRYRLPGCWCWIAVLPPLRFACRSVRMAQLGWRGVRGKPIQRPRRHTAAVRKRSSARLGNSAGSQRGVGFHRHVLDYFWTAITPGRARSHRQDGSVVEGTYAAGETRHYVCSRDEYNIHDLENVGDTDLWFTTVEFLDSANKPLELSAGRRPY
jgi:hypothetical protein